MLSGLWSLGCRTGTGTVIFRHKASPEHLPPPISLSSPHCPLLIILSTASKQHTSVIMPRAKQMTQVEKTQIKCWSDEGVSAKDIAGRLGRHAATVRRAVASMQGLSLSAVPPPAGKRSGRPKITSTRQDFRLKRYIMANPFKTAKEIKREVPGFEDVHVRTIQRTLLKRLQMPSRNAAAKPLLTPPMVKKRLAFCKKYLHMSEADWEMVMFSDESMFRLINPRATKVRRVRTSNRYLSKYTVKTVKHPASVMLWGCFSGKKGRGSLFFLPKNQTMNSDVYMGVLQDKLFPWMEMHQVDKFLQDGAPCHKSKRVMALLQQQEFIVLDWPGNSPDLNPIENVWSIMKGKLKKDQTITSLPLLISALKVMWVRDLPVDLFKKLAHSMPNRLRMCIANGGQMTKY